MSLTLVATPIGNLNDISARAIALLKAADVIILEEFKESTQVLRAHGITQKNYMQLNEHTTQEDLKILLELCQTQSVVLITDCGTPGFCDPGADLVKLCREKNIAVSAAPGPSSLMNLLSLSSERLNQFVFRGFLPAENEARKKAWYELSKEKRPIVILDTPYRLEKTLVELNEHFSHRKILLALNMTQETEQILEGTPTQIIKNKLPKKAEFMVLIYS